MLSGEMELKISIVILFIIIRNKQYNVRDVHNLGFILKRVTFPGAKNLKKLNSLCTLHRQTFIKMVDDAIKKSLGQIPLLKTKAGIRDSNQWSTRLKEEYQALIHVNNV